MNIQKFLGTACVDLRTLVQHLHVQLNETNDPDDRADLRGLIEDVKTRAATMAAFAAAYGPILQSAIDMGIQGKTHKITVSERAESALTGEEIFVKVSEHEFICE